jgi:ribosomal protein L44E
MSVGFAPASNYANETSKHTSIQKEEKRRRKRSLTDETNAAFSREPGKTGTMPKPALEVNTQG